MVFSTHIFVFYFLPFCLLLYYCAPRRGKHFILTVLSYAFYGWTNPRFIFIMLFSTMVDYFCALTLAEVWKKGLRRQPVRNLVPGGERTRTQKIALIASIVTNLSLLGVFKYFNFGMDAYNSLMGSLGLKGAQWMSFIRITLPLGISFYTFQSMSYTIDVYRGHVRAIRNFIDFACYVAMFPQLVAGPIIRFREVASQFESRTHTMEKFARGVAFFAFGMAKKVLIANPCGKIANTVFDAGSASALDAWYGVAAYAFQIYFDFSAYSDMAIGLGLMMGFVFPKNFNSPFHAKSITEFWSRWHLSLSLWLRDYLYIPLGGNKKGSGRTYVNLMLVMILGGLWHGAGWTFLIWGGIHGACLVFERLMGKDTFYRRLPGPVRVGLTFFILLFTWVIFRAANLSAAVDYLENMFGLGPAQDGMGLAGGLIYQPYYLLSFGIAAVIVWGGTQTWDFTRRITFPKAVLCFVVLVLSLIVLSTQSYNPFIYFIF